MCLDSCAGINYPLALGADGMDRWLPKPVSRIIY